MRTYANNRQLNTMAYGVYTPINQFSFNKEYLLQLGFTLDEIAIMNNCLNSGINVTINNLNQFVDYQTAKKIKYMYDICTGKIQIETTDELCRHLKKMFGNTRKVGIRDLIPSKIDNIPRKVVINGITDEKFKIYNSSNYKSNYEKLYDLEKIGQNTITIKTKRKPVLRYGESKTVDGVIAIKNIDENNNVTLEVNKKYTRQCNRFIVVASLKYPEFYHSMVEIICIEGTKVYVFAKSIGKSNKVMYNNGTQRVYDYGFFPYEIDQKVTQAAAELYSKVCGVYAVRHPANQDYPILIKESVAEEVDYIED